MQIEVGSYKGGGFRLEVDRVGRIYTGVLMFLQSRTLFFPYNVGFCWGTVVEEEVHRYGD